MQTHSLPFGPPLDACLLASPHCLSLSSYCIRGDLVLFLLCTFPDRQTLKDSPFAGIGEQVYRAVKLVSNRVQGRDLEECVQRIRQVVQTAQDSCAEVLDSVKIMKETETVRLVMQSKPIPSSASSSIDLVPSSSQLVSSNLQVDIEFEAQPQLLTLERYLIDCIRDLRSLNVYLTLLASFPELFAEGDMVLINQVFTTAAAIRSALMPRSSSEIMKSLQIVWDVRVEEVVRFALLFIYRTLPTLSGEEEDQLIPLNTAMSLLDRFASDLVCRELCKWFAKIRVMPFESRCSNGLAFHNGALYLSDAYKWLYAEMCDYLLNNFHRVFPGAWHADVYVIKRFIDICLQVTTTKLADASERQERMDLIVPLSATLEFEKFLKENITLPLDPDTSSPLFNLDGVMSSCFTHYLHTFVVNEQEILAKTIERVLIEEKWVIQDERILENPSFHFSGVDKLMNAIEQSINKLRPLLPDQTMYLVFKQYQRAMVDYLRGTDMRIPVAATTQASIVASNALGRSDMNLMIAIALNAEYLAKSALTLPEQLKIKDPDYIGYTRFEDLNERVGKIRAKTANALALAMHARCEIHLAAIKDARKDLLVHSGDESAYAKALMNTIKRDLPRLQKLNEYITILSAFLNRLLPLYVSYIRKLSPVPDVLAEQLMLDTQRIRKFLIELPGVASNPQAILQLPFPPPVESKLSLKRAQRQKAEVEDSKNKVANVNNETLELKTSESQTALSSHLSSSDAPANLTFITPSTMVGDTPHGEFPASVGVYTPTASFSTTSSSASSSSKSLTTSSSLTFATIPSLSFVDAPELTKRSTSDTASTLAVNPPFHVDPLVGVIDSHLVSLMRALIVLAAPSNQVVSIFRSQWPKRHSDLLIELMDQKGITSSVQEKLVRSWNANFNERSAKRIDFEQRNFVTNLLGDFRKRVEAAT